MATDFFPWRHRLAGRKPLIAALGVTCAILLSGCEPNVDSTGKELLFVEVVTATQGQHSSWTTLTGEIQAETAANLSFQVNGQVVERLANVGDRVRANQVLARLSSTEQIADREAAQAALETARSGLEQASSTLRRQRSLLDSGLTTRSAHDAAVEAVATGKGTLARAEAALQSATEAIERTELRAFSDGTVTARYVEVGQVVQAGQSAFTVAADGPREAVFNVDEGVLTDAFAAQSFKVHLFDRPDVEALATLKDVSPTIDKTDGTVEVTLSLSSVPDGMSLGSVVATTARYLTTPAFVLPAAALTSEGGQPAVWIVEKDTHTVSRRPIELTAFDNDSLVVTAGIAPQELVVTAGANLVYPDQIVAIKE